MTEFTVEINFSLMKVIALQTVRRFGRETALLSGILVTNSVILTWWVAERSEVQGKKRSL